MSKGILKIGKTFIVLATLWPVMMTIDAYRGGAWWMALYDWGERLYAAIYLSLNPNGEIVFHSHDRSWEKMIDFSICSILFLSGFLLSILSKYKGELKEYFANVAIRDSVVGFVIKIFRWVSYFILGFWGLVLFLHLFHFLFLTPNIEYTIWTMTGIGVLIGVFLIGSLFQNTYSSIHKDKDKTAQSRDALKREERKKTEKESKY